MKNKQKIPSFFKPLFWSYDFSKINLKEDKKNIIINTLNRGNWQHWQWIFKTFGKNKVKKTIENTPASEFRDRALKLICLLLGIKKIKYASRSAYVKAKKSTK